MYHHVCSAVRFSILFLFCGVLREKNVFNILHQFAAAGTE